MNLDRALAQSKHSTPKCSGPTAWTRWVTCPLGFWIRYFRTDLRERVAINCLLRKKESPKRQCGRNWSVKEELIFSFSNPHTKGGTSPTGRVSHPFRVEAGERRLLPQGALPRPWAALYHPFQGEDKMKTGRCPMLHIPARSISRRCCGPSAGTSSWHGSACRCAASLTRHFPRHSGE